MVIKIYPDMIVPLLKNYKALTIGGVITLLMILLLTLSGTSYFIVDPNYIPTPAYFLINAVVFICSWLLIAYLISRFPIYKILGVIGLLVAAAVAEHFLDIRQNPITIPLIILFWLGVTYLILPQFFRKYRIVIFSVYGLVIFYYLFIFLTAPDEALNHRLDFAYFMFLPIPIFAALWVYEQWRWLQILKSDKAKAELTLLKNQINPHFFFNTLNNLYGLAVEKSEQAPAMILKLSDIMRYTIYDGKADYVALNDEVAYMEDYIELHKIRYQKKVDIDFKKDLQYSHEIAPLLLIVPLENAFKHGVESLAENAFIHLEVITKPEGLLFSVRNNYESSGLEREGIGLMNLKKRLALIYPDLHELEIVKTEDIYTVNLEIQFS
jgi:two-component system LytT family sensor kinase